MLDLNDGDTCGHDQMNDLGNVNMDGDEIDDGNDF